MAELLRLEPYDKSELRTLRENIGPLVYLVRSWSLIVSGFFFCSACLLPVFCVPPKVASVSGFSTLNCSFCFH